MPENACISRRALLSAVPPAGIAILTATPVSSSFTVDPVIGLLRQHRLSLENETDDWKGIEHELSARPPVVTTREVAIECLRTALRIDNMGSFETALVSSALDYLQR